MVRRLIPIAALALVAAACSSTASKQHQKEATREALHPVANRYQLKAPSSGAPQFDKKVINAGAGRIELVLGNPSSTPHNVAVKGNGVDKKGNVVSNGQSRVVVTLKPGTYEFYCSVDGHEQAGMKGKLVVGKAGQVSQ